MLRISLICAAVLTSAPAMAEGWNVNTINGVRVHSHTPAPRPEPVFIPVPAPAQPPTTVIINQPPERPIYRVPAYPRTYDRPHHRHGYHQRRLF
jgi:hypothetical protein